MGKAIERTAILRTILSSFTRKQRGGGGQAWKERFLSLYCVLVTRAMRKKATGVTKWCFLVLRKNNKKRRGMLTKGHKMTSCSQFVRVVSLVKYRINLCMIIATTWHKIAIVK